MSLGHGAGLVTNNLVFYYDTHNTKKSWKGPPATNLFTETNLINWSNSATVVQSSFTTPFDNPSYVISDTSTTSYNSISRNVTVANDSSSYTVSLFVRKTFGATSARLGFNTGFNTGGTTAAFNQRFNSDTGVANWGTVIDYGDWWYWYFTISNNGTGNTNLYCEFFPATGPYNSGDQASATGTAIVGEMMLVVGNIAARFTSGTRSNTQAILDLIARNTVTATNLTYTSNGFFSFNGSNSSIQATANSNITGDVTLEAWFKSTSTSGTHRTLVCTDIAYRGGAKLMNFKNENRWGMWLGFGTSDYEAFFTQNINDSTVRHMVGTWNQADGVVKLYMNGNLISSINTGQTSSLSLIDPRITVGIDYHGGTNFQGELYVGKVYTSVLNENQVKQNFNALRGRYGI